MTEAQDNETEGQRFKLPEAMHKGDVFQSLLEDVRLADLSQPIIFDASAVERMTTPCALLVLATARSQAEAEVTTVIENPSGVFVDAFSDLGLFDQLMTLEFRS